MTTTTLRPEPAGGFLSGRPSLHLHGGQQRDHFVAIPYQQTSHPSTAAASDQASLAAARLSSTHAKLHKRNSLPVGRNITVPVTTNSGSPQSKRTRIKRHIRSLSLTSQDHEAEDEPHLEESLGPASGSSHSASPNRRGVADISFTRSKRQNRRSDSHSSSQSNVSTALPYRAPSDRTKRSNRSFTPDLSHSCAGSYIDSDHSGGGRSSVRDGSSGRRAAPHDRPPLHINTSGALEHVSSKVFDDDQPSPLPAIRRRRGTNQSVEPRTSSSRTSLERALPFMSRGKDEPMDSVTRTATIQAARQAFQEREELKTRKLEAKEQIRAEKQQRRDSKVEDRRRRKSDANSPRLSHELGTSSIRRPGGLAHASSAGSTDEPGLFDVDKEDDSLVHDAPKVTRKRKAKSVYIWFLTWLKTKILNLGSRRQARKRQAQGS